MNTIRLQKFLSQAGIASRRKSEELILSGKVVLNGKIVKELGTKIDPKNDTVEFEGKKVEAPDEKIYIILNKPTGYTTTREDMHAQKTVYKLLPEELKNVIHPVGRLDKDSEGLLIFTNDGELTYRLTHPSFEHKKQYEVEVKGILKEKEEALLEKGVEIDGKETAPAEIEVIKKFPRKTKLYITIHEGRNRQIRKMFEVVKKPVQKLKRVKFENVELSNLKTGEWKEISKDEILG